MVVMTSLPIDTVRGRELTAYDVAELWDESQRLELIDGVLIVMDSPVPEHQIVQAGLLERMFPACPRSLRVLAAPFDIIDEHTAVQPDIIVIDREVPKSKYLEVLPKLVVEILSPSTRLRDLNTKFKRYERAGIPSYWVIDPAVLHLIVWELHDGRYVEVADVSPEETWTATQPFEVAITPGRLLD